MQLVPSNGVSYMYELIGMNNDFRHLCFTERFTIMSMLIEHYSTSSCTI